MKRTSTLFLKTAVVLLGTVVLAGLILIPPSEGVNANKDLFSVYFKDPFIAYVYLSFVPFFAALYQALKLLSQIERNRVFSEAAVKTLRNIKYCTAAFAGLISLIMPYMVMFAENDDAPGVVAIPLILIFAAIVIATSAGIFQGLLQSAINIKSENDLTV